MLRKMLPLAIAALLAPAAGHAEPPLTFKSVSLDFPQSDRMFPAGPGSDAINNNCLACHSADMVLNQPALPRAAWQAEVNKMITVYKAPVAAADVGAIVEYLARTKGAD
jgi:hypothetical protein